MQLLAGQQPRRKYVRAQPLLNGRRQASRPFVGKALAKTQPDTVHGGGDWRGKAMSSIENRFFA
jgi:hypothetical protein